MALAKKAQTANDFDQIQRAISGLDDSSNWEDVSLNDDSFIDDNLMVEELDAKDKDEETTETTEKPEGEVVLEVGESEEPIVFHLPFVPGGANPDDTLDDLIVEEPEEKIEVNDDPWHWKDLKNLPAWMKDRYESIPRHSGRDIAGIERAIAYLKTFLRQVSKATQSDINGVLDINQVQDVRNQVEDGINRLEERLNILSMHKKKKKAEEDPEGFLKEAQKISGVNGRVTVTVPLLISHLARIMINGTVSAGHDMEDMFKKLAEKFDLTLREKHELVQLVEDMGYPIRLDRAYASEDVSDYQNKDHFDWNKNYQA